MQCPEFLWLAYPPELTTWLAHRLNGVPVLATLHGQGTLDELAKGEYSLLIIDHGISGPPAPDVVERTRNTLGMLTPPVVYCLDPAMASNAPQEITKGLGVVRLLIHPIDREEIARLAVGILSLHRAPPDPSRTEKQQKTLSILTRIWGQIRGTVMDRLEVLELATAILLEGDLQDELRQRAEGEAHKLGGLVGTFGYPEGTRLAKQIERILDTQSPLGRAEALMLSELVASLRVELERPFRLGMSSEPDATNGIT